MSNVRIVNPVDKTDGKVKLCKIFALNAVIICCVLKCDTYINVHVDLLD